MSRSLTSQIITVHHTYALICYWKDTFVFGSSAPARLYISALTRCSRPPRDAAAETALKNAQPRIPIPRGDQGDPVMTTTDRSIILFPHEVRAALDNRLGQEPMGLGRER